MNTGRNTLLKDVLDFFMDYEIKSDRSKQDDEKRQCIKDKKIQFTNDAKTLIDELQVRMEHGKKQILSYAGEIGASFDKSKPGFSGTISDVELYSALNLIVEYQSGIKIPVSYNGLGYNNLIFMSLLLSKMQVNADGKYLGSNAKIFPVLAIEEPEAHLHPTMQYQFLKFLRDNKDQNRVRQIFITTHSTNIAASVLLDEMVCLFKNVSETRVGYPGKVFPNETSKKYVQRFLDATKSDMLFAEKIIFVEGIAEQLLMPVFAQYMGISLEEEHVAVLNVGGRYFNHFLYLFDGENQYGIRKKIVCLTDIDPERREKGENKRYEKCYPFEYDVRPDIYEYHHNTYMGDYLSDNYENIKAFTQSEKFGKTFEYELVLANPSLDLLVTDSVKNSNEIIDLMKAYEKNESLLDMIKILRTSQENERIINSLQESAWAEDDKRKALIASRYLNSIGKGENALELACVLKDNFMERSSGKYRDFKVPEYIKNAIDKVCLE